MKCSLGRKTMLNFSTVFVTSTRYRSADPRENFRDPIIPAQWIYLRGVGANRFEAYQTDGMFADAVVCFPTTRNVRTLCVNWRGFFFFLDCYLFVHAYRRINNNSNTTIIRSREWRKYLTTSRLLWFFSRVRNDVFNFAFRGEWAPPPPAHVFFLQIIRRRVNI